MKEGTSVAKQVFEWLDGYPYLRWGLKEDYINFSSIARKIGEELKIRNFDAVLVAIRRYQQQLKFADEEKITGILKKSSLEIQTKINIYIIGNLDSSVTKKLKKYQLISSHDFYMLITDQKLDVPAIKKHEDVIRISIKSPQDIEKSHGFVAVVCGAMAEAGINIVEMYSVWTDNVFILDKKDLTRAVECLEKIGIR